MTEPEAAQGGWDVARDRADAYIARDRRRALSAGLAMPDRVHGSAIFADISGFTPLTEGLARELGPQRGAEELTATLSRVFHAVIAELDAYDGNVIYFSGDAITCWIDGDDGTRAGAAALGMQAAIARTGTIVTPSGTTVELSMKVAIAVGDARRFVVGDPDVQLIDVLAGRLIDQLAEAEHHAQKGEIVLDESAVQALGSRALCGTIRVDGGTRRACRVLDTLLVDVTRTPGEEPPPLPEDIVRAWLLPAVYERLRAGRGEFLAELRPAIPVFVRFTGIDYDDDDDAIAKLDDFVRAAQRIFDRYGGNLLQLTLGDKGAYLYGVFGSPLAHEDDAARAAAAVLELRDLEKTTAAREIQVGLTSGRLRSGTYGHEMRRTFVCLGDAVNLAARLMSAAPAGEIYVAGPVREAAGEAFIWERLPDLRVKGKEAPVETWLLRGSLERASRRRTRFQLDLIGREAELAELEDGLARAVGGQGSVVGIAAEAGMGKSRLVAEFVRNVRRRGQTVAFGECQPYGTKTPYFVWREIWRRLLGVEEEDATDRQIATLEARVMAIDPGLVPRVPLLADVVGLSIPDSDLTRGFDAKLRKTSLEDLLATLLRARAEEAPFAAVLEDCHWIDELSRDLLEVLVRSAASLPVLFVLAYRPSTDPSGGLGLATAGGFREIVLDQMPASDIAALVRSKLAQLVGPEAELSDALADLIAAKADGNPFYVEELLNYVVAQGVDLADASAVERVELPESLHGLVLSRIDAAAEGPRRTMKVASVIGRVFEAPMLPGAYDELGTLDAVLEQLDALRALDLVALDREADQAWMFKHAVTQEVAYESLPFALRAVLHGRIGDYIEQTEPDLDRVVPLLEHHYWRSDRPGKKLEYLRRAAVAAQAAYANNAAIAYYERLLTVVDGPEHVQALLGLGKVLDLTGDWARASRVGEEALASASELDDPDSQGWALVALADIARKQGRLDNAAAHLDAAKAHFESAEDEAGVGQVLHLAGTVSAMRGDLDLARARYQQSLEIRERLGDTTKVAALYSNLAIVAEYEDDLVEAQRLSELGYEMRLEAGDRWGLGVSLHNLGVYAIRLAQPDVARARVAEAMQIMLEVGDAWFAATERMLLGNIARDAGNFDEARAYYAASIPTYLAVDDPLAQAEFLEDVALLAVRMGAHERAIEMVEAAAVIRETIGVEESPSAHDEFEARLAPSRESLTAVAFERAKQRGRALGTQAAIGIALDLCGSERPATA